MAPQPRPGILDPSTNNPFAHPSGWLGRLAGRFMLWTNKQDDVVGVLGVQPGDDVLEIGYGPGGLIRLLAERTDAASIRGVDPSPEMRDQATRHNRKAVRSRPGSARPRHRRPHRSSRRQRRPRGLGEQRGDLARPRSRGGRAAPGRPSGRHRRHRLARRHETVPRSPGPCACRKTSSAASSTCCGIASSRSAAASCRASTYSPQG